MDKKQHITAALKREKLEQQHGFTLLELLIAVALMGVLLSAVLGVETQLIKGDKSARESKEYVQDIYSTLTLFEDDVTLMLESFKGKTLKLSFRKQEEASSFDTQKSNIQQVTYLVQRETGKATLLREEQDAFIQSPPSFTPLLSAKNIYFSYMNKEKVSTPVWESTFSLPVSISLFIEDEEGHVWQRTVPLIVRSENGGNS